MIYTYLAVLLIPTLYVEGTLKDKILDELIEIYKERNAVQKDDIDPRFCSDTPLECYKCAECHDHLQFGLCIKGATESKCLCKWGWTGSNAVAVPNAGVSEWSRHRIRADHCKTPCHYTHDYWRQDCLNVFTTPETSTQSFPHCNVEDCKSNYGTCIDNVCIPDGENERREVIDPRFCGDTPLECYKCAECHDHLQFGLCIKGATESKCLCKWGWTGSNAVAVPNAGVSEWSRHRIRADHCKTPCHYTHDYWRQDCLNVFTTPETSTQSFPHCNVEDCKSNHGTCIDNVCIPDGEDERREIIDPRFCGDTPLECYKCAECHDHQQFGLCIKGALASRCLCKWGWTGSNAVEVPNIGMSEWSVNRIRADHCSNECHYTHNFWNPMCTHHLQPAIEPTD